MRTMSCPVCRVELAPGEAHCPRCGLRVAALSRGPATTKAAPRLTGRRQAVLDGLRLGGVLLGLATAVALIARVRGGAFLATLDNAATVIGGLALCISFLMGGVRVSAVRPGAEIRDRLAPGPPAASDETRIAVAVAGALALTIGLLVLAIPA